MFFASRLILEHKAPSNSGWIRRKYFQSLSGIELHISPSRSVIVTDWGLLVDLCAVTMFNLIYG